MVLLDRGQSKTAAKRGSVDRRAFYIRLARKKKKTVRSELRTSADSATIEERFGYFFLLGKTLAPKVKKTSEIESTFGLFKVERSKNSERYPKTKRSNTDLRFYYRVPRFPAILAVFE